MAIPDEWKDSFAWRSCWLIMRPWSWRAAGVFLSGILWEEGAVVGLVHLFFADSTYMLLIALLQKLCLSSFCRIGWLSVCCAFFESNAAMCVLNRAREILEEHLLPFVYSISSLTVVVSYYMCSMVFFGWEAPSISKHVDFHSRFFLPARQD